MKKILVIKLSALGDFIFSTGLLFKAREENPQAQIDLLTGSKFVDIAKQMGIFDHIYTDDRPQLNLKEWYRITKTIIANGQYDAIFDFQANTRTRHRYRPLAQFFARRRLNWLLRKTEVFPKGGNVLPTLDFCHGEGKNFHLLPQQYVLMLPGCAAQHQHKRWPKEKYAAIAQRLAEKGISTLVLGTSDEATELNYIAQSCDKVVNFMNKASLLDIPDIAKRALCVVGNDTGPTHMSSLVKTPTLVLFCKKTAASAQSTPCVTNFIGETISDIAEEDVYKWVQEKCPIGHS